MIKLILRLCVILLGGADSRAADSPPNILFLFADDQRADTIAALGNPLIRTPNLDRLVHGGLSFKRAYMQGGFQGATCVPSRAMLLSGRSLFHADETLLSGVSWPEAFAKAGYTTFISGKWHNGNRSLPKVFQIARSVFAGGMTDPMHAKLTNVEDGRLAPPKLSSKHACQAFADETVRFLKEHKTGPFFAYVPFDAPHDPHIVPEDFPVHYDPATIPVPPNFLPLHPFDNGEMKIRDERLLPWPRTPAQVQTQIAEYYRYISYLDSLIGQVLDALEASPFAKNTIVVFAADSGVARGSHGLIGKQNLYEHSVGVPLIVSGPGIPANRKTDAMCYLFDVLPTLGAVCHVPAPEGNDGRDLSAVLRDPDHAGRSNLVFAYRDVQRAIRDDRWKLIRYPKVDVTQLFDLSADPFETRNLATDPAHMETVRQMSSRLAAELQRADDKAALSVSHSEPAAISADQLNGKGSPHPKPGK
jgi:arylsulfatase A-like enzyme